MSRILVTGASGFIGRALVPALMAAGHEVRAATRAAPAPPFPSEVETVRLGDLVAPADWSRMVTGMDFVIHLAGIAHTGPGVPEARYDLVNHRATAQLADVARTAGVQRLVFVSSIRAQTGTTAAGALTEADPPQPTDAYGRSKLAAEAALARSGVSFTILRPVLVYGPGVKGNLHALARLAALPIPLPFAACAGRRSLVSLENLIAAISHVLRHEPSRGETYIVADPQPLTLPEMITAMRRGLGQKPRLVAAPFGVIRLCLTALGRRHSWDQLNGALIADPAKLIASGWQPNPDTIAALAAMAREGLADHARRINE